MSANNGEIPVTHELLIQYRADGSVTVNGPIHDRMFCYALLALAQDIIRDFSAQRGQSQPLTVVRQPLVEMGQ